MHAWLSCSTRDRYDVRYTLTRCWCSITYVLASLSVGGARRCMQAKVEATPGFCRGPAQPAVCGLTRACSAHLRFIIACGHRAELLLVGTR